MSEVLGAVYVLIGLASLALAVLVPPRATNVLGGLLLASFFSALALERFTAAYYRLVDLDPTADRRAAGILIWSSILLFTLCAMVWLAWRLPERTNQELGEQLDRMEKAALEDQEGGREHRDPKKETPDDD